MATLISISWMGSSTATSANWWARVGRGALVRHLRVVTVLPVRSVTHHLDTTIGQSDTVFATDHVSIASRLVRVFVGSLGVAHGVVEVERHSRFVVVVLKMKRR